MIDSFQSVLDSLLNYFEDNPNVTKFLLVPLCLFPFVIMSRMLTLLLGFFDVLAVLFRWIFSKFVDLLCSFEFGFKLAYKFGWAKPGVHFFDCGIHCSTCPKFLSCTSELKDEGGRLDV